MGGRGAGSGAAKGDSLKNWFDSRSQAVVLDRGKRQITVTKRSDGKFNIADSTGKNLEKRGKRVVLDLLEGTVRVNGKVKII